MHKPKTSLREQYIKLDGHGEKKVKYLDSLYTQTFIDTYFNHCAGCSPQSGRSEATAARL